MALHSSSRRFKRLFLWRAAAKHVVTVSRVPASDSELLNYYKIIQKQMGISLKDAGLNLSTSNTRGGSLRLLQYSATSVSASSHFKLRAALLWNSLPTDLLQLPKLSLFKPAIRNKLLADYLAFLG